MNIIDSPSKNFWRGRNGHSPLLLIIHITDGYYPSDLEWLRGKDPRSQVSSHYYIAPNSNIHRLVKDEDAAWHAGVVNNPTANLLKDENGRIINPNYVSLGIELSLRPPSLPQKGQLEALKELIGDLSRKHKIPLDRSHILGHNEIRKDKTCPFPLNIDSLVKEMLVSSEMVVKEELKDKIIGFIKSL